MGTFTFTDYLSKAGCARDCNLELLFVPLPVIVTAVEMMLDKFDRRISDRFKIIGYKDDDNAKLVSALPDHIANVALPVTIGNFLHLILMCLLNCNHTKAN